MWKKRGKICKNKRIRQKSIMIRKPDLYLQIGDRVMFQKKPGDNWERAKVIRKYNDRSFEIQTSDGALYRRNRVFINKSNSDHNLNPSVQQNHKEDKSFQVQPVKDSVSTNAKQNYITRSGREVKPLRSLPKNEW